MVCTFAHELLHVAQKDASSGGKELGTKLHALLTPQELAAFHKVLEERYNSNSFATELPAFLAGDAMALSAMKSNILETSFMGIHSPSRRKATLTNSQDEQRPLYSDS